MLDPELVRFLSYFFDVTEPMISWGAIFHLELSPMPAFSFHLEGSSVSIPFFRSPYYIGEAKILLAGIYSLA